jgi:putative FmdB family regulatory protein
MRYDYECSNKRCRFGFEIHQRVSEEPLKKCPACKKRSLERVILEAPLVFMGDPRTIGGLLDKNTRKMGKYELQEKRRLHKESEKAARVEARKQIAANLPPGAKLAPLQENRPWYGKLPKNIEKSSDPKRVMKYIREGQ